MDLKGIAGGGSFDSIAAIRLLARKVAALESGAPSATMESVAPSATARHVFYRLLDDRAAKALLDGGLDDIESVRKADDGRLLALNGIGPSTLKTIREAIG